MKTFKDISIFQGIVQFFTGSEMIRAIYQGCGIYHIFIESENSFIFKVAVRCKGKSPKSIYNAYCNA